MAQASDRPRREVPTTDRERAEIDSGQARDKIAFPDPAAAPLGTDAEAAGYPPTTEERKLDSRSLTAPPSDARSLSLVPVGFYLAAIAVFAILMFVFAWMMR